MNSKLATHTMDLVKIYNTKKNPTHTFERQKLTAIMGPCDRLGFIFRSFNLVPTRTAVENITLPLMIGAKRVDKQITTRLGLTDRLWHRPAELSGGQQQRATCARALVAQLIFGVMRSREQR